MRRYRCVDTAHPIGDFFGPGNGALLRHLPRSTNAMEICRSDALSNLLRPLEGDFEGDLLVENHPDH
jgi:hypothetical protein